MELTDFQKIEDYKKYDERNLLVNRGLSANLGLRRMKKGKNIYYKTGRWCGCCWLKKHDGTIILDETGNREVLQVTCRFNDYLRGTSDSALVNMISVISKDKEFPQYLCDDLPEEERLITFFTDEDLLPGNKISEDNRLITIISFVVLLEKLTRRFMIRHTIRQSENLTGNIRGRILFNKHIAQNLVKGREDRIYCQYTTRTTDTPENRFLKYALKQADMYLKQISSSLYQKYSSDILACRRRFSEVADVRCAATDLDRIILPGMYASYRPALRLAKVILTEISMNRSGKNENTGVLPYAVNMPLLFECYARTRIREALKEVNAQETETYRAELLPFVPDKQNVPGREGSYLPVFSDTNSNCYIRGNLVPDIVIAYRKKDQTEADKPEFYRVYDVKYKDRGKSASGARADRLQILAYDFMYNSNESVGHIFPEQKWIEDKKESCWQLQTYSYAPGALKRNIENQKKQKKEERDEPGEWIREELYYLEFYLGGSAIIKKKRYWLGSIEETGKEDSDGSH